MADFPPPPTYAEVILVDERSKKGTFNPIWLNWFLTLAAALDGAGGTILQHNDLSGLQGGTTNEFFHLTSAEYAALGVPTQNDILQGRVFGEAPPAPADVRAGTGITVSRDALGFLVTAVATVWDLDQNILANQVFGG